MHEIDTQERTTEEEPAFSFNYNNVSDSSNSVALSNKLRCVPLADLPDILPDKDWVYRGTDELIERLKSIPCSTKSWKTRHREELGQQFVNQLWAHCLSEKVRSGRYQYPIHPDVFPLIHALDKAIDNGQPVEEINQQFADLCYGADGRLRDKYKYLWQSAKDKRRKCPACEAQGKKRTCRLIMLTNSVFGAIRYKCGNCGWLGDVWKEFPVFGSHYQSQPTDACCG